VIVALGGGITAGGEPRPATVARARRAITLYRRGRARRIVMSGAYGMYDPPPRRVEATAMAQIALAAGVPQGDLGVEAQSRDTIGNIWFTKPLLREHRCHRVIVVTSGWHAPRVHYLTQTIWGPGYHVAVEPVTGEHSTRPPEEIALWEEGCWRCPAAGSPGSAQVMTPRSVRFWPGNTQSTPAIQRPRWPLSRIWSHATCPAAADTGLAPRPAAPAAFPGDAGAAGPRISIP
jgi:hypothetical protein